MATNSNSASDIRSVRGALDVIASIVMIVAGAILIGSIVRNDGAKASAPTDPLIGADVPPSVNDVTLGHTDAPIVMVELLDFQCPFCSKYAKDIAPILKAEYVDRGALQISFRHLPLPMHDRALSAATAAECARQQGAFWEMHDLLFANPQKLDDSSFMQYSADLKLDSGRFSACLKAGTPRTVDEDSKMAAKLNAQSTPLFLIGRRNPAGTVNVSAVVRGAMPIEAFRTAIDKVVREGSNEGKTTMFGRLFEKLSSGSKEKPAKAGATR